MQRRVYILRTYLLIQTKIAEQERRNYQEQVITQMERKITNICEAAKVSMEQSKYFEFANMHMLLMMEQCRESLDSITNNLDDRDLKVLVNSRYQLIFGDYCKEIAEIPIVNKPMYTIVTPREHHSYYDSLIANQLPFQPYPMKK